MTQQLEQTVWEALRTVTFPGMSRDVVSFGFVERVQVDGAGAVSVDLQVPTQNPGAGEQIRDQVREVLEAIEGAGDVRVSLQVKAPRTPAQAPQQAVQADRSLVPEVEHIVAVASGKGGVGKSTVASNLAVALAVQGKSVGLLDCDIYGPSQPLMFGITDKPRVSGNRLLPFEKHGIRVMSLGFVLDADTPVIWRGPMVMKAIEQLLGDVEWGRLDYLIVDLPPGTGDAQLTLTQRVPLAGAVIVSTPQDVALIDARKGIAMFQKVSVPVLGVVENMSFFVCPHCQERSEIFKHGGAERVAQELGSRFLGAVPLDPAVVQACDDGIPIVVSHPDGAHAEAFRQIADAVIAEVERRAAERPELSIL